MCSSLLQRLLRPRDQRTESRERGRGRGRKDADERSGLLDGPLTRPLASPPASTPSTVTSSPRTPSTSPSPSSSFGSQSDRARRATPPPTDLDDLDPHPSPSGPAASHSDPDLAPAPSPPPTPRGCRRPRSRTITDPSSTSPFASVKSSTPDPDPTVPASAGKTTTGLKRRSTPPPPPLDLSDMASGPPSSSSTTDPMDVDPGSAGGNGAPAHGGSDGNGQAAAAPPPVQQQASADAKSVEVTTVKEGEKFIAGSTNRHPPPSHPSRKAFVVGVSEDRNRKCRRTMEDSHSFAYSFGGVDGQGYFAIFDGHAGKHAAEWCGEWFHEYLLRQLASSSSTTPVPDLLNTTFHIVDTKLSQLAAEDGTHSGCTAVTAFLRLENADGTPWARVGGGVADKEVGRLKGAAGAGPDGDLLEASGINRAMKEGQATGHTATQGGQEADTSGGGLEKEAMKQAIGELGKAAERREESLQSEGSGSANEAGSASAVGGKRPDSPAKRTLYTANVGDARAVLSRGGKAVRLTYDHKGSDAQEAKRITDAGGFVMNNRVNGVLAVTRSLGDSSMKEFVVGSPYTTETTLGDEDEFLIVACDGLWDVCGDQEAVDLVREIKDPQEASQVLLDHALQAFSTDNLSVLVVTLRPAA